jgi:hypothetical protein
MSGIPALSASFALNGFNVDGSQCQQSRHSGLGDLLMTAVTPPSRTLLAIKAPNAMESSWLNSLSLTVSACWDTVVAELYSELSEALTLTPP